ncbi:MAG: inositol monophosphatase, partial [Sphingobacteriales bacterium]
QEYFQGTFTVDNKEGINNLVTEVDTKAETRIIEVIKQYYPEHFIISEEVGELSTDSAYRWIIDPIDGTVNFAHGIPICCVSIALVLDGVPILGAVYNPMMNEFFFAEKGKGAFLNDRRISVSQKSDFRKACLVTGFPYKWPRTKEHPIRVFERFILEGLPVRRLGSAAIDLCWVACGRFDGFWEYNLSPWDIAAGYLLVEEAGGKITNFDGGQYSLYDKQTLATNGLIHEEMIKRIQNKSNSEE